MKNRYRQKWKILCNDELWFDKDVVLQPLKKIADIDFIVAKYDTLLECIGNYEGYYASASVRTDRQVLNRAKRLKVIATPSTGTDHIDVDIAREKGITVLDLAKEFKLLDTFSATAEHAWCLLLALVRRLPWAFDSVKKGQWGRQKFAGRQLMGKTLGILGYGRLGKMVAEIGKGFQMNVIACDVLEFSSPGVRQVDFYTLLGQSDVLSINVHLTKETRGLFSSEAFSKMKKGMILINTSRGAIVDEYALLDALNTGHIAGAGLDVVDGEWSDNLGEHPLIKYAQRHDNLLITPHIGGSTVESITGAREFMARKLAEYLESLGDSRPKMPSK